jgi:hypothetical protein
VNIRFQELRKLGTEAAAELTRLHGENWVVESEKDDTWPSLVLAGPASGARLQLIYGYWATGKVTVVGVYPKDTGTLHPYRANVDPERGGTAIGRAAYRRVLRGGYLDELPERQARRAEMDARAENEALRLGQAAELFGVEVMDRKVFVGDWVHGGGYAEMYSLIAPDSMNLSISGIPADVALEMLAVLAKHGRV